MHVYSNANRSHADASHRRAPHERKTHPRRGSRAHDAVGSIHDPTTRSAPLSGTRAPQIRPPLPARLPRGRRRVCLPCCALRAPRIAAMCGRAAPAHTPQPHTQQTGAIQLLPLWRPLPPPLRRGGTRTAHPQRLLHAGTGHGPRDPRALHTAHDRMAMDCRVNTSPFPTAHDRMAMDEMTHSTSR